MFRRLFWVFALGAFGAGCAHKVVIHPRAKQADFLCAQYIGQGNLDQAEIQCNLALEFNPDFADAWTNKGLIEIRREHFDLAKKYLIKAIRYNEDEAQAYNDLGYIYLQKQEYGKAHDNYERALKVNPDFNQARYGLALTFKAMGKPTQAKKELETIIAIKPTLSDPHLTLGLIEEKQGARDAAIKEFSTAVRLSPDYAEAWLALGDAYSAAGRYLDAKDAYTSCLAADSQNVSCRNNLPIVARKAALLSPSVEQAKDESRADKTPASLYQLGLTYREKGLINEEERAYKKCLRLDGRYAPCHWGLFQVFRDLHNLQNATIACKNFLRFASVSDFPKETETCQHYLNTGAF